MTFIIDTLTGMNRTVSAFLVALPLVLACGSSSATGDAPPATPAATSELAKPVADRYAVVAKASYDDVLAKARALKTAVDAFAKAPSAETLDAAKKAWLDARDVYGQTEAFRFYGGPIDDETEGPEGRVNGWPLDEAFIDYVVGDDGAGIINHTAEFPSISTELLSDQNEKGGESNISTGWHAIEFLLWGQDLSETGPGARPFSDYVPGATGAQKNAARRADYLGAVTELLVDDLEGVARAWDASQPGTFGARFLAAPTEEALTKAFKGMVMLSALELTRERMNNAYTKGDQEEEHSCFSDNTLADLRANALAIENVYLGRSTTGEDGIGVDELVAAKDAAVDARVKQALAAVLAAVGAIPAPFDQSILREPGRSKVKTAIDAAQALTDALLEASKVAGVTVNVEQ
jgi:putative iron-regulated protein